MGCVSILVSVSHGIPYGEGYRLDEVIGFNRSTVGQSTQHLYCRVIVQIF